MFAQYASSFTRSARDVLAALEQEGTGNLGGKTVNMQKEWSFLNRFEQNFNHSFKVSISKACSGTPLILQYVIIGTFGRGIVLCVE